jgi:integrase
VKKTEVAKPIGLSQPKGRPPQIRVCIPLDLQPHYGGRKDFRVSLGRVPAAEAKAETYRIRALKDAEFAAKRRELALALQPLQDITPEMAQVVAQGVYSECLHQDDAARETADVFEALRELASLTVSQSVGKALAIGTPPARPEVPWSPLDGLPEEEAATLAELNSMAEGQAAVDLARRKLSAVQPLADRVARSLGLAVDWTAEGGRQALRLCLEQYRKACKDRTARDAGEVIPTPARPMVPTPGATVGVAKPQGQHRLRDVFDKWKASGDNPGAGTVRKKEVAVRLYEQFTKDAPIESLTMEQGAEFSGWLLKKCKAEKTAKDHMDAVKSLLNKATKLGGLGWLHENPWQGHRIKVRKATARKPWSSEDLRKLFDSPLFSAYQLPEHPSAGGAAGYWIPLLGLYTGARQSELCQLRVADIEASEDGLSMFITSERGEEGDDSDGTSTKTEVSRRRIPVHPELVRLGFDEYWKDTRQAGHKALFPQVQRPKGRPAGEYFSDWFLVYRREQGIATRWVDFHALRHTASTRLTDAGVADSVSDYLTGHSSGGVGAPALTST